VHDNAALLAALPSRRFLLAIVLLVRFTWWATRLATDGAACRGLWAGSTRVPYSNCTQRRAAHRIWRCSLGPNHHTHSHVRSPGSPATSDTMSKCPLCMHAQVAMASRCSATPGGCSWMRCLLLGRMRTSCRRPLRLPARKHPSPWVLHLASRCATVHYKQSRLSEQVQFLALSCAITSPSVTATSDAGPRTCFEHAAQSADTGSSRPAQPSRPPASDSAAATRRPATSTCVVSFNHIRPAGSTLPVMS